MLLDLVGNPNEIAYYADTHSLPIHETPLLQAIGRSDMKLVELVIARGARVNDPAPSLAQYIPLQKAASMGYRELTQLLLEHNADVNADPATAFGGTALQFAAISGDCKIAAELLTRGVLAHAPPCKIQGRWPIKGAAEHGRLDMILFLWAVNQETLFVHNGENGLKKRISERL
ncbi:ankyrin repeat-containing domain protein [Xylariaceae sp. FL1272]|nr:ankyrin repeat-containing domain protein [Xylariaceae sp. FL1272]